MSDDLIKRSDALSAAGDQSYIAYEIRKKIRMIPSAEPRTEVVAQINFDEDQMHEIVDKAVSEFIWTPCSERMPEDYQRAIACNKHGDMMIGTYTNWGWMFPCYFEKPVAWMPLPNPYKEDEDDE